MSRLSIALTVLALSWLPTTASATLLEYDLEFKGIIIDETTFAENSVTYFGTALIYFDGMMTNTDPSGAFNLDILSFDLDFDGTTVSGNGTLEMFSPDQELNLNFADGGIHTSTHDLVFNHEIRDSDDNYLYNELTIPLDTGPIGMSYSTTGGDSTILDNADLGTSDRSDVFLTLPRFRFYNGTEVTVPEPSIFWLIGSGLGLVGLARRRA